MSWRTLGELRGELLARLGMGAMGASGGANQVLIDSFLRDGQSQLYQMQDWRQLTWYQDYTTGVGQNQYDYPDDADQSRRILRIEVVIAGQYIPIKESISTEMWSTMDTQGAPARFEKFEQLLIYPKADAAYTLRVWYVKDLMPFTENSDRATIDDGMIFLHALANAKAHYRHPDAARYEGQLDNLLARIKGQSFKQTYQREEVGVVEPRPAVVGRDA